MLVLYQKFSILEEEIHVLPHAMQIISLLKPFIFGLVSLFTHTAWIATFFIWNDSSMHPVLHHGTELNPALQIIDQSSEMTVGHTKISFIF